MASIIKKIRMMRGVGVLADRTSESKTIDFLRNNLIYGFNGSGKSTLSRLFASLQTGVRDERLPPDCVFEFELDDGARLAAPSGLKGLEKRVLVFNADFIERNLQWSAGTANPVFYIGREQAGAAAELARQEAALPVAQVQVDSANARVRDAEKTLTLFKRERARLISEQAHFKTRRYEAPQLEQDFTALDAGPEATLTEPELNAERSKCQRDEPMAKITKLAMLPISDIEIFVEVREIANQTLGFFVLEELDRHPDMVLWVKQGSEYHNVHGLSACLFCGSEIQAERRLELARAFDDRLDQFLARISKACGAFASAAATLTDRKSAYPQSDLLLVDLRRAYKDSLRRLLEATTAAEGDLVRYAAVADAKLSKPTTAISMDALPDIASVASRLAELDHAARELNSILCSHNTQTGEFRVYQEQARIALRRHYVADARQEYDEHVARHETAKEERHTKISLIDSIKAAIVKMRSQIREHGLAAEKINQLIHSYLGHSELTISAVSAGYEIHRHHRLLSGPPSEGEKTAIALCYFLSALNSDGRSLKDLILVIDDPISSLDSKSLNYACSLVKASISKVAQVFLLTHNLPCMNEFKKHWKNSSRSDDELKPPTAKLLFLDVVLQKPENPRESNIIEMSKLLREYDFEYHYLFNHLLKFQTAGNDYDYAYMMPNVLRRVLDVFLAFRCPGNAGLTGKIEQLCKAYPALDRAALLAVDRLVQTESHSDSLDDLVTFSSMTVEESRRAADALLEMMHKVDPQHKDRLMMLCAGT